MNGLPGHWMKMGVKVALVLTLVLATIPAAAELTVLPSLSPEAYVDDNRRMRTLGGPTVIASVNNIALDATYQRPTYELFTSPRFRLSRYTKQTELDSEDYFLDFGGVKIFRLDQFRVAFEYERESTATTQLEDAGRVAAATYRTIRGGNASWSHFFGERLSTTIFGGHRDVKFDRVRGSGVQNYRTSNIGIRLNYVYSDRTTLIANANVSTFETPESNRETDSYALQFGMEHAFSDTVFGELMFGQNISRIKSENTITIPVTLFPPTFVTQEIKESNRVAGLIANAELRKNFTRGVVILRWDRSFSPSSQGARQRRQVVSAYGHYNITNRLVARLYFSYRQQQLEADSQIPLRALDIYEVRPKVEYHISKSLSVNLYYRFRHQIRPNPDTTATSNRLGLQLAYEGGPLDFLR